MTHDFKQFSPAARLYAQNFEIVEEMEKLFVEDISRFLDAVRDRMNDDLRAGSSSGSIGEEESPEYRNWWIEDNETGEDDYVPHIWFKRKLCEIITPGELTLIADFNEGSELEKRQLSACKSALRLPPYCTFFDRRLFGVTIAYGDRDPVEAVAGPILSILTALHTEQRKIFTSSAAAKPGQSASDAP